MFLGCSAVLAVECFSSASVRPSTLGGFALFEALFILALIRHVSWSCFCNLCLRWRLALREQPTCREAGSHVNLAHSRVVLKSPASGVLPAQFCTFVSSGSALVWLICGDPLAFSTASDCNGVQQPLPTFPVWRPYCHDRRRHAKTDFASMDTSVRWEYVVRLAACYAFTRLFISRAHSGWQDEAAGSLARTLRAPLLIVDVQWSPHLSTASRLFLDAAGQS